MSPYREAVIPFTHLRTVEFGGALHTVKPHNYGRWACPACGHWRFFPFTTFSLVKYTKGEWVPSAQALLRACADCHCAWLAEPRTKVLP